MGYTVSSYPHGAFSWADVFSTDFEQSRSCMKKVMGWTDKDFPTGEGRPDYTMFYKDGKVVAGGAPGFAEGMPSFWSSYVTVDDLDEVLGRVEELGGTVTMPAMDVLTSGRMATIQDPTGAQVSLWQPGDHIGAELLNTVGAMGWNDLMTPDLDKAQKFYGDLLGWTYDDGDADGYVIIRNKGRMNGGMMSMTPEMGDMPPSWTVYFSVASIEDAVQKVKEAGGSILKEPTPMDGMTFMVVADPTGAVFSLVEMSEPPDEWEE